MMATYICMVMVCIIFSKCLCMCNVKTERKRVKKDNQKRKSLTEENRPKKKQNKETIEMYEVEFYFVEKCVILKMKEEKVEKNKTSMEITISFE